MNTNSPHIFLVKPGFLMAMIFFFYFCIIASEIPAQDNTRYRIQVAAMNRVEVDYLKLVCKSLAEQFGMRVYILDQDNYYKIAIGDFTAFGQAKNRLAYISIFFNDAWIIPPYNEFVIYSVNPKHIADELPVKPQEPGTIVKEGVEKPVQDTIEVPEPVIEPLPIEIPEAVDEPVADPSDLVETEPITKPQKPAGKKLFWKLYGSGVYIDLHSSDPETRYCTYYGYGVGTGVFYTITKNLAIDVSASCTVANAVALYEKHDLSGKASALMVNPSLKAGTDFFSKHGIYGKVGAGYFNYDYAYNLELKPGFSGGPASVETALLERAITYGLEFGIGVRVFHHFDASFITWFDQNSRRFYRINMGIVF